MLMCSLRDEVVIEDMAAEKLKETVYWMPMFWPLDM